MALNATAVAGTLAMFVQGLRLRREATITQG